MLEISTSIDINAPANEVWTKLAKLDDVQDWAESVQKSYYSSEQTEGVGTERTCEVQGLGTLREKVTQWRDGETLTYTAEGMPKIVRHIQNTWRLEALNEQQTRVTSTIELQTRYGVFGALMAKLVMRPQMTRLIKSGISSFKDFVEHSTTTREASVPTVHTHIA